MRVETVGESIEGLEEIEGQIRYFLILMTERKCGRRQ